MTFKYEYDIAAAVVLVILLVYNYFRMFISIHIKQSNRNSCRESGPDNGIL